MRAERLCLYVLGGIRIDIIKLWSSSPLPDLMLLVTGFFIVSFGVHNHPGICFSHFNSFKSLCGLSALSRFAWFFWPLPVHPLYRFYVLACPLMCLARSRCLSVRFFSGFVVSRLRLSHEDSRHTATCCPMSRGRFGFTRIGLNK